VVNTYGADALRFTIAYIAPVGQDIRYSNEKCEIGRNFANKIWNAVRFRLRCSAAVSNWQDLHGLTAADLRPDDQWIIARTNQVVQQITTALEKFSFNEAVKILYDFVWSEFCDWYLESCKALFTSEAELDRQALNTVRVFDCCLSTFLRLLHPFMPFVTDELYHQMGFVSEEQSIMLADWPVACDSRQLTQLGADDSLVALTTDKFELIRAVRNLRANYQISSSRPISVIVSPASETAREFLLRDQSSLQSLLVADHLSFGDKPAGACGVAVSNLATAYVPLAGMIDFAAELARLHKQEDEAVKYIESVQRKLANANFVARAPEDVVNKERERIAEFSEKLSRIRTQIEVFTQA